MIDAWQPSCTLEHLQLRAQMLSNIRAFFHQKAVLEVETPLLGLSIGTDPQLAFFSSTYTAEPLTQTLYLQTSPEFAMKRLLAAGCGSIFQICKAFRNGESGRFHNPEFTLLEWYRVGFDLQQLMAEIIELLSCLCAGHLQLQAPEITSYQEIFHRHTGLDALEFSVTAYQACAESRGLPEAGDLCGQNQNLWLDLLFSHCVQPKLGKAALCLIHSYPICQSSLARLNSDDARVTDRVELFINGIELGNGYFELCNASEQKRRFESEALYREQHGLAKPVIDRRLLAALASGLPDCSGMAIGLDRLLMLLTQSQAIEQVLSFPIDRC